MKRPLTLWAALAALNLSLLAQDQPPPDAGYHRLGEGGAASTVVVERPRPSSSGLLSLQGVRIGRLNFNGVDGGAVIAHATHDQILRSYKPRIEQQLQNAGIQVTGDPGDFILSLIVSQACNQTFCGGEVEVYASRLENQRMIIAWQARTPFVGYPSEILPNLVGKFVMDYLRDNQQSRQPQVIEIPGGPLTQKR